MHRRTRLGISIAALITISSLASACGPVYLRSGGVPTAGPSSLRGDRAERPTAALALSGALTSVASRELVQRVTENDAPFRAFEIVRKEPPAEVADYRLTLDVAIRANQPNKPGARILIQGFGHILTMGLVPLPLGRDEVLLTAVVRDRHDAVVGRYVLEDTIVAVQQTATILLPLDAFASRERATTGAIENMLRTVYRRMAADGLLATVP